MAKKSSVRVKPGTSKGSAEIRRKVFVEAYLANGGNATQAAETAGYSKKSAHAQGCRLLKDVKTQAIIKERQSDLARKYELTTESVIAELAKIVHADPRKLFDASGNVKRIQDMPDEIAGAIASIEISEIGTDGAAIGYTKKIKLWDKNSAIEKAMKHLGLYAVDNEQSKPEQVAPIEPLELARRVAFLLRSGAETKG